MPPCTLELKFIQNPMTTASPTSRCRFTIRRIADGTWWDFNSLFPAPKKLSNFYVAAYLSSLEQQGYTIFVVTGKLPEPVYGAETGAGRWMSPEEASRLHDESEKARQEGYLKAALEGALVRLCLEKDGLPCGIWQLYEM